MGRTPQIWLGVVAGAVAGALVLVSACETDIAAPAMPPSGTSTSMTKVDVAATGSAATAPTFEPRLTVATIVPAPEGDRTSDIALSVQELASGDLTGDGHDDLVVTRVRWSSVETYPITILVNDGRGGFRDDTIALFDGPVPRTQQPRQTILADFNGDRRLDIFVADTGVDVPPYPGSVSHLALSSPDGRYVDATNQLSEWPGYAHAAAAGDVDGDGDLDLFLGQFAPRLLLNRGSGAFVDATDRLPASIGGLELISRAAFVDVDGDGPGDLVVLSHGGAPAVLRNDGSGRFAELRGALPPKPFADDAIGTAITVLDLDDDGHRDLVVAWTKGTPFYEGRWVQTLVNNGDGTFRDETASRLPQRDNSEQWVYEIVPADLDGDGLVDLGLDLGPTFADPTRALSPLFFLNRGDGTYTGLPDGAFEDAPFGQFRVLDADADGRADIVSAWAMPSGTEIYAASLQAT